MPMSADTPNTNVRFVEFHGGTLVAVMIGGVPHAPVKHIADELGLSWQPQIQRLKDDPLFAGAITFTVMPFTRHGQAEACLPLKFLRMWLVKIDSRRVNETYRERVLLFQRECVDALEAAFNREGTGTMVGEPADGERWKFAKVAEVRLTFGHRAAQQMYFALGLTRVPAMHEPPAQREMFEGEPGDNVIALLLKE